MENQQTDFNNYPLYSMRRNNCITSFSERDWQEQQPTNILLIDDEEDILYTFKQGLSSEGYNVKAFADPVEALTHFVNVNPSHYDLAHT